MSTYDAFAADLHAHCSRDPNARVYLGFEDGLGRLPDPSLAAAETRVAAARALLARLDAIDREGLDFDQRLDLDLAHLMLSREVHDDTYRFNGRTRLQQLPTAGEDIGDPIFQLFINDPRPAAARLEDITARLEAAPAYLEGALARLDTPVARWVAIDLETVEGLPSLFDTVEGWAAESGWSGRGRLAAASAAARSALAGYAERLAALPTTTHLHLGEDIARDVVRHWGIDLSLESLHGVATAWLAETRALIEALRARLVAKHGLPADTSSAALQSFLARRYRVEVPPDRLTDVLARYQEERERILAFIRERDLFPILDAQDMKILRTPSFMAPSIPAGAMMSPPPFREGVRTSLVYLTLSEELLDEHTELSIPGMMIHEGIPGHHLQLATASAHPSLIRRHVNAMEHAEGWTTMLEDYMLDVGYAADLADEVRFVTKRDLSRIGARVAIDLFFMTGRRAFLDVGVDCDISPEDPFEAAGNLLIAVTGFVPGRAKAELNWYSKERGYPLSYLTGNHLVWALKRDVTAAQAGRLEGLALDRVFHRIYLKSGNMPVRFLRRVFEHQGLL